MDGCSLVFPLGVGSKNGNLELKMCLRGVEKHLSNIGEIFIIGEKPDWIQNVTWKSKKDERSSRYKEKNIYQKIRVASKIGEVSENFLFMNDDHFLLSDFDATNFPYHYKCNLTDTMQKNNGNYRKTMNHTRKYLLSKGYEELDFDTHCPIIYNKELFLRTFEEIDWNREYGYGIKSLYCGLNGIKGEQYPDCKIQKKMTKQEIDSTINGRLYFSIGDAGLNDEMKATLLELYPNSSKYEK